MMKFGWGRESKKKNLPTRLQHVIQFFAEHDHIMYLLNSPPTDNDST